MPSRSIPRPTLTRSSSPKSRMPLQATRSYHMKTYIRLVTPALALLLTAALLPAMPPTRGGGGGQRGGGGGQATRSSARPNVNQPSGNRGGNASNNRASNVNNNRNNNTNVNRNSNT